MLEVSDHGESLGEGGVLLHWLLDVLSEEYDAGKAPFAVGSPGI